MQVLGAIFLFFLLIVEEQTQPVTIVQPVPTSPPATSPPLPLVEAAAQLMEDEEYALLHSMPTYKKLLESLAVKKGIHAGDYKCHHCNVNKKTLPKEKQPED